MPTWLRVRDNTTGHEFDRTPRQVKALGDAVTVLDKYPPNDGPGARPRPAKHRVTKAGKSATTNKES